MSRQIRYGSIKKHPFAVYLLTALLLLLLISFTTISRSERPCLALKADIYPRDLSFLDDPSVLELVDRHSRRPLLGQSTFRLNIQEIEARLSAHEWVEKAEVYRMHNGDIRIAMHQKEPLARLIYSDQKEQYLTEKGELIPLSDHFTARVLILRLPYPMRQAQSGWQRPDHPRYSLWETLLLIRSDDFWRAQIAECLLDKKNELKMYTQLSRQLVFFGQPVRVQEKLNKLYIFYRRVLPQKGWNRYRKVDLRFAHQIVCK